MDNQTVKEKIILVPVVGASVNREPKTDENQDATKANGGKFQKVIDELRKRGWYNN